MSTLLANPLAPAAADHRPWAIYVRISKRKAGDGRGAHMNMASQRAECVAYVQSLDPQATIVDFSDNASAWDEEVVRDDWQRMLAGLAHGDFKGAVAWHADRFTRQPEQLEHLIKATRRGKAGLHTRLGGWHRDPTLIRIESAMAASESDQKAERQKLKHLQLAQLGKPSGGERAYGWNLKRTALVPAEAAHVRWAAQQLLAGRSLRSITLELNQRGARTVRGKEWRSGNLGTYLRRPMLAAQRVYHGEIVGPATWPAILDLGTWEAVRHLLENPARRVSKSAPRVYLLTGVATCGTCGGPIRGRSNASSGKGAGYFCDGGRKCVYRRADLVDAQVRAAVVARLAEVDATGALLAPAEPSEAAALQVSIAELEGTQASLVRLLVAGQITEAQLVEGTQETSTQLADLRGQLAELEVQQRRPAAVLDGLAGKADAGAFFDALPLEGQKAVVQLLATVTIHPQGKGGRAYDPELVQVVWRS